VFSIHKINVKNCSICVIILYVAHSFYFIFNVMDTFKQTFAFYYCRIGLTLVVSLKL